MGVKSYLSYWVRIFAHFLSGDKIYFSWIILLTALCSVGGYYYFLQLRDGLIHTNMSDSVSWGVYIANFTFLVGVAASAVLLVVPAYLFKRSYVKEVVILGELLAFVAIVMCLLFIMVDLGRPDRFLHILPFFGRLNFPRSILAWDVVVLMGYLLLNLYVPGYLLYKRYMGEQPTPLHYLPFVFLSIGWAVSIHTVTAFLYSGLGGRPFWNSAILAPRFLISAFASGPAILFLIFLVVERVMNFQIARRVFELMRTLMTLFLPINFFLLGCEFFNEFYTDTLHNRSAQYLFFGLHGAHRLTPIIWTSVAFSLISLAVLFSPLARRRRWMAFASMLIIVGIWIEKGVGLIIPGFIPSPTGLLIEYTPSRGETAISLGIWAFGALLFTLFTRIAVSIQLGRLRSKHL